MNINIYAKYVKIPNNSNQNMQEKNGVHTRLTF